MVENRLNGLALLHIHRDVNVDRVKILDEFDTPVTLTTDGPRLVLMDRRMNRNYNRCTERVFINSQPVNGKRKQTLKQNLLALSSHTQTY
jgi:hypothetical protein